MSSNIELSSVANNARFRDTATISGGGTTSTTVDLDNKGPRLIAIAFPSGYVGGNITLQVSNDDSTWYDVADKDAGALTYTQSAGDLIVDTTGASIAVSAFRYLRLVAASAVTGDQTLTVVMLR